MTNTKDNYQIYPVRLTKDAEQLLWLNQIVENAQKAKFYGTFTISMKEGEIKTVEKNESFKPPR